MSWRTTIQRWTRCDKQSRPNTDQPNQVFRADKDYFYTARHWSDDQYVTLVLSHQRYRRMCLLSLAVVLMLSLCLLGLIPAQHVTPLLVHHYADGQVSVSPLREQPKIDQAQIESDLVRYVQTRESYDAFSYRNQYTLVHTLSTPEVAKAYRQNQAPQQNESAIHQLGQGGVRTVHVDSVIFLDRRMNQAHQPPSKNHNLAEVTFSTTDHFDTAPTNTQCFTALVAWEYRGMPKDLKKRWQNWSGFVVTHYRVQPRHINTTGGNYV